MRARKRLALLLFLFSIPAAIYGTARYRINSQIKAAWAREARMAESVHAQQLQLEAWQQITDRLTEPQLRKATQILLQRRREHLEQELTEYFALSKEDRVDFLDERIDQAAFPRPRSNRKQAENNLVETSPSFSFPSHVDTHDFRSRLGEYRRAMHERRLVRGLPVREVGRS